jgi:hypothetical protein
MRARTASQFEDNIKDATPIDLEMNPQLLSGQLRLLSLLYQLRLLRLSLLYRRSN